MEGVQLPGHAQINPYSITLNRQNFLTLPQRIGSGDVLDCGSSVAALAEAANPGIHRDITDKQIPLCVQRLVFAVVTATNGVFTERLPGELQEALHRHLCLLRTPL